MLKSNNKIIQIVKTTLVFIVLPIFFHNKCFSQDSLIFSEIKYINNDCSLDYLTSKFDTLTKRFEPIMVNWGSTKSFGCYDSNYYKLNINRKTYLKVDSTIKHFNISFAMNSDDSTSFGAVISYVSCSYSNSFTTTTQSYKKYLILSDGIYTKDTLNIANIPNDSNLTKVDLLDSNCYFRNDYLKGNNLISFFRITNNFVQPFLTSINQIPINSNYNVYPNPVSNLLHIEYTGQSIESSKLELFNSTGLKLLDISFKEKVQQLNMTDYSNGVYFIFITNKINLHPQKFKIIKIR